MKLKFNLGEGGIKGFFVRHVEKIAFILGIALVGLFIYLGWSIESYSKTPNQLKSLAERARSHIHTDSWADVRSTRLPPSGYAQIVQQGLETPTAPNGYATVLPLKPPLKPQHTKRKDPQLFSPVQLEVVAQTAAVLMRAEGGRIVRNQLGEVVTDVLASAENAGAQKEDEAERKRREARERREEKRTRGQEGVGDDEAAPYGGDLGDFDLPGFEGSDPGGEVYGDRTGSGGMRRHPGPVEGFRPGDSGGLPVYRDDDAADSEENNYDPGAGIPVARSFVAVKALVPYSQQIEEYERALSGEFFERSRDVPRYIYIWVQRAEVPKDPNAPLQWTRLDTRKAEAAASEFAGRPVEIANAIYLDIPKICHAAPPVLLQPMDELLSHSGLPKPHMEEAEAAEEPVAQPAEAGPDLPGAGDLPGAALQPASPHGGVAGVMDPGDPYGAEFADSDEFGGQSRQVLVPEFKLVRFFDFTVQPGKTYKYQIQLFIEDPNSPDLRGRFSAPNRRTLATEVAKRLDARKGNEFWRLTEWSEESPAVTVPIPDDLLAGDVIPSKITKVNDVGIELGEPSGKFVPVVWDWKQAVGVPALRDVYRGSLLNFNHDAEVVHPVSLIIKLLEGYTFQTDAMIVDLRGGEALPNSGEMQFTAPGEFALIDSDGKLVVRNELDDWKAYRWHTLQDEKEAATAPAYGMPAGEGDDGGDSALFDGDI